MNANNMSRLTRNAARAVVAVAILSLMLAVGLLIMVMRVQLTACLFNDISSNLLFLCGVTTLVLSVALLGILQAVSYKSSRVRTRVVLIGLCASYLCLPLACYLILKAPAAALRANERSAFKVVLVCLSAYADEHNGTLPPNISMIVSEPANELYEIPPMPRVFSVISKRQLSKQDISEGDYDFTYTGMGVSTKSSRDPARIVVLHSRMDLIRDGLVNVAFLDGHIETLRRAQLTAALSSNDP